MNEPNYYKTKIYPVFNEENADQFVSPDIYSPTMIDYPDDTLERESHLTSYLSNTRLSKIRPICQDSKYKFVTARNASIYTPNLKFDSVLIGVDNKAAGGTTVFEVSLLNNPDQFRYVGQHTWVFETTATIKTETDFELIVNDEYIKSPTFESKLTVISVFNWGFETLKTDFYFINDPALTIKVLGYKLDATIYSRNWVLPEEE